MYILTIKNVGNNKIEEVRKIVKNAIDSIEFSGVISILKGNGFPVIVEGSDGNGGTLNHYLTEEFKGKGLLMEKVEF